ncbi:MAG: hypothetical protein JO060_02465, partial [Candidatus Eremiobacteraeota bacterium]|nr:hypothetical protein [Candidatus Eremiobacteraeota bacterium]
MRTAVILAYAAMLAAITAQQSQAQTPPSPIQHVVIILQENRTFENIFHGYPGAATVNAGKSSAGGMVTLQPVHLMTPWDPAHRFTTWNTEYNAGMMDGFDRIGLDFGTGAPANFAYSYAMRSDIQPYWDMAKEGTLADAFFADHRSQSFAGHQFPIAGASGPVSPTLPNYDASENPSGGQTCTAPGSGLAVNLQTGAEDQHYSSCFDYQTIADLLVAKGRTWRFYIDATSATSSYVSSFAVIKHIRNDPAQWANVISPATTILSDAQNGTLPNVSYVVGSFANSDHAGQTVPSSNGPSWVTSLVNGIGTSPSWGSTAILLTYDDWGGWYDEVSPPASFNAFEPGFRLPFLIISPYARRGSISHVTHYWGSVLHFI